ncbi:unnamed protein product [Chrysoparadoxa australica]
MKAVFLCAFLPATLGFVAPSGPCRTGCNTQLAMTQQHGDRKAFLSFITKGAAATAGLAVGLTGEAKGAGAAAYFGKEGNYPGVIKPEDAVKENAAGSDFTAAGNDFKKYLQAVQSMQSELQKNSQADLRKPLEAFEFDKIRKSLNSLNNVFDEDTQRGTDRLGRVLLQDTVELIEAAKMKPDVPRTARRVDLLSKKLVKLERELEELSKFF